MTSCARSNNPFKRLYRLYQGHFHSQFLLLGIQLGVFNHLEREMTADEIADRLQLHPTNTVHFLDGLVTIGLLEKCTDTYKNTDDSQAYLVQGTQTYLGDYLLYHAWWNTPLFENFEKILREGPPQQEQTADAEAIWASGASAIANYQHVCTAPILSDMISNLPEFPTFTRMLDLAGGPGLNAAAIVAAHPTMQAVLFDRPSVIDVAKGYIRDLKLEDRFTLMAGDFLSDPIGKAYDLVLASACLNFAKPDLLGMITRIHESLNPGGVLVSVHDGLTQWGTSPQSLALSLVPISMMWQDLHFEKGQIASAMVECGFKSVMSEPITYGVGEMVLDIGRKV